MACESSKDWIPLIKSIFARVKISKEPLILKITDNLLFQCLIYFCNQKINNLNLQILGDETDEENEEMSHDEPMVVERDFYSDLVK